MNVLNKIDILKKTELKKELVEVEEWGGSVWVQEMSGSARAEYDNWMAGKPSVGALPFRIVVATAVDENNKPMFSELDIPDLMKMSSIAINKIANKGAKLSGLMKDDRVEEVKNSEPVPSADSPSGSVES